MELFWFRPRQAMLSLDRAPEIEWKLMGAVVLSYFSLLAAFALSLEKLTLAPLISLKGLLLIMSCLLALGFGLTAVVYAFALAVWVGAKCLNGEGSLAYTRAAVIWTLIWTLPLGLLILVVYFTIRNPDHGQTLFLIRMFSYAGILATLLYGLIALVLALSQCHRFSVWKAGLSVIAGAGSLAALTTLLAKLF